MTLFGKTFFLIACVSLLFVSSANAMLYCCQIDEKSHMELTINQDSDCHSNQSSDDPHENIECQKCECQHCAKISALFEHQLTKDIALTGAKVVTTQSIYSFQPEGLFWPPKYIS